MAARSSVKVLFSGKEYVGEYDIEGTMLRVFFDGTSQLSHIRGSDPELLARLLLIELVIRKRISVNRPGVRL